ncbi:acyl carrier protein [Streptomyces syringium]|uniref:acyl carrier protein n=1 Tax=Streptomyces syringium TaxID=76729 RepID=UPI00341C98F7
MARNDLSAALTGLTGLLPTAPDTLFPAASRVLTDGADVAGISAGDWARARRMLPTLAAPRFALLVPAHAALPDDNREELLRSLAAMTPDDAVRAIAEALARLLATVLRTDPAELDPDRRLTEYGIDSLMGAEFLVHTREYFDVSLSPTELLTSGGTLTHIAHLIHQRLIPQRTGSQTPETAAAGGDST